jgi:hypothetical protein
VASGTCSQDGRSYREGPPRLSVNEGQSLIVLGTSSVSAFYAVVHDWYSTKRIPHMVAVSVRLSRISKLLIVI